MAQAAAVPQSRARWFVPGDWDGFFALFFSGFPDLLLIAGLAPLCGFSASMVTTRILPGVALSIFAGNIFSVCFKRRNSDCFRRSSSWQSFARGSGCLFEFLAGWFVSWWERR